MSRMPGTAQGDLVTAPVPELIRRLAIPASVGFFFNTMYNVVDTFWAGRLSTDALAALSLSFPVFFVLIAMGSGFSTGATALIGNALGRGDRREAALTATQGLVLGILLTVVVMTAGYLSAPSLFRLLGARTSTWTSASSTCNVILAGSGFVLTFYMFNGILNAQGDTQTFRDYLIVATVANIVLDPWFMYGGFGLPAMGVRGIALATVVCQAGGLVFLGRRAWRTGLIWRSEGARWRPDGQRAAGHRRPGHSRQPEHDDRGPGHLHHHLVPERLRPAGRGRLRRGHPHRADRRCCRPSA